MTPYGKTLSLSVGLSAVAHVIVFGVLATLPTSEARVHAPPKPSVPLNLVIVPIQPKPELPRIAAAKPEPKHQPAPQPVTRPPVPALAATPKPAPIISAPSAPAATTAFATTAARPPISQPTTGVEVNLSPAQPDYYSNPAPAYPRAAKLKGWQGTAILRVEVKPDGKPGRIEIAQSSGYPVLDEASMEAIRSWKFVPAKIGDQAVAGTVEVPITFKLVAE